jgi:serine/threonine-protein kinase
MELDDLKQAFRTLEEGLAHQSRLNLEARSDRSRARLQASLWPLYATHAAEILLGLALALAVGPFWVSHLEEPHLLIAGVVVHVYAVAMIALGSRTLALLSSVDFSAPVVSIQQRLARVRRAYLLSGLVVGLPWCMLWIPFSMLFVEMLGFDFYASFSRAWFWSNVGVSAVIMLVALWLCRELWFRPSDPAEARKLAESSSGRRLLRVQSLLDELAEFAKE